MNKNQKFINYIASDNQLNWNVFLILVVFCFQYFSAIGKISEIDSLELILANHQRQAVSIKNEVEKIDTQIINIQNKLAKLYSEIKIEQSNKYAQLALNKSIKIKYVKGVANALLYQGNNFSTIGDYKTSNKIFKQLINYCTEQHYESGIVSGYLSIASNYFQQSNYPESLKNNLQALKIEEKSKTKNKIARIYTNLGMIYFMEDKYPKAEEYYAKALKYYITKNDKEQIIRINFLIGAIHFQKKDYDKALKYFSTSLELSKIEQNEALIAEAQSKLASTYLKMDKYKDALNCELASFEIVNKREDMFDIGNSHLNIGRIYYAIGNYVKAEFHLNKSLEIAERTQNIIQKIGIFQFLVVNDSAQGKYLSALSHYRKMVSINDSLFNKENTEKIVQTRIQYEFDKKEAAIKAKQAINDAIAREKIQQHRIAILSVVLGSALVLISLLFIINRRKSKHALEVNKLENKTLRSQLNPHFIFNALASIQKYMNEHPEKAENYLAKFGKLMREVLESSEKEYIPLLDEFDMLKNYMDLEKLRVSNGFDYEFLIDENIDIEEIQIPPLLLQPIAENAIWHGVAHGEIKGKIKIVVSNLNDLLQIEIENESDDYSKKVIEENYIKRKSFGLQIVKERLALLSKEKRNNSNLEMIPTKHGMKVKILLPY